MYDIYPGYRSHRTIPVCFRSKEAYIIQPLEYRLKQSKAKLRSEHKSSRCAVGAAYDSYAVKFDEEDARKDFVFKMYFLLSVQYSFILGVIVIFALRFDIGAYLKENPTVWVFTLVAEFLLYVILVAFSAARSVFPVNFVLISLLRECCLGSITFMGPCSIETQNPRGIRSMEQVFYIVFLGYFLNEIFVYLYLSGVLCIAVTTGAVVAVYEVHEIIYMFAIQTAIIYFATILTKYGPCDAAGCVMIFCVTSTGLIVFFVVVSLVWIFSRAPVSTLIICGITITIYTLYLLFDTQFMMDESSTRRVAAGHFVKGNIHLWVDLVLMFFYACDSLRRRIFNRTVPPTRAQTSRSAV